MKSIYVLIAAAFLFAACGSGGSDKSGKPRAIENGPVVVADSAGNGVQYVYRNWILVSEQPMKADEKGATWVHGTAKDFYDDGALRLERTYNMGKLEGMYTEYYDTGEKYYEVPYVNNKQHGNAFRYKKDGTVVFKIPYEEGMAAPGIEEYNDQGKLAPQPTIEFIRKGGNNIEMKLSNDNKSAEFYQLIGDSKIPVPTTNGVAKMSNVRKGDLKIRAVYKTSFGNKGAVDGEY